jgi:hypothetical protein
MGLFNDEVVYVKLTMSHYHLLTSYAATKRAIELGFSLDGADEAFNMALLMDLAKKVDSHKEQMQVEGMENQPYDFDLPWNKVTRLHNILDTSVQAGLQKDRQEQTFMMEAAAVLARSLQETSEALQKPKLTLVK